MSSSGSGVVDPSTARTINTGRETIGVLLGSAQKRLQHVFIAFVVGLLAGIMTMRLFVWPQLEEDLLVESANVIAQTPFDVILMQVKIGLFTGVGFAIPVLLYHARKPLQERDVIPEVDVSRLQIAAFLLLTTGLGVAGVAYAYFLFFPLMFDFLAGNAVGAGLAPKYSIVKWTEFIFFLAFSFMLAAQLPLVMSALSYTGIIPYETFRDKWKIAIMVIFVFGAFFSPPEPFTQILWAAPLLLLYGFSVYLAKTVVTMKRGREHVDVRGVFRDRWNRVLGVGVLGFAGGYAVSQFGGVAALNDGLQAVGASTRVLTMGEIFGVPPATGHLLLGAVVAVLALVVTLLYYTYVAIERAAQEVAARGHGDPSDVNLDALDAEAVRVVPPETFAAMSEEDALAAARRAMSDENDEKAQAILDRYDDVQERLEEQEGGGAGDRESGDADQSGSADASNPVQDTATGMVNAFTDDETTEDDIGGYYYDIRFVLGSLRSRAFHIVGSFMVLLAVIFGWFYYGGFADLRDDFIARIPSDVRPEAADIAWPITLHPVEALVFQVKISTVLAAVCVLPLIFYYLWPSLSERGLVAGDRRAIVVWGGGLVGGLAVGSYVGYSFVAPEIISYLVYDALSADMVISYTVSNFAWTIFLLTVGIGLLADIPVTMVLFHIGGIVSYDTMWRRWRVPVLSIFAFAALVTPNSLYTMFVISLPMVLMYGVGLALLHLVTLGGRRGRSGSAVTE
jgi:sec-independent protein translocase protein TatC